MDGSELKHTVEVGRFETVHACKRLIQEALGLKSASMELQVSRASHVAGALTVCARVLRVPQPPSP